MLRLLLELLGCFVIISVIVSAFRTSVWFGGLFKRKPKQPPKGWS